ncbi:bifunctional oligoribonuclease/PAP phosphatase NrnA [Berryella wangjianweii]|uniref:Bifunctional oligoribonuclease/PAP phosphatase NrnA n=1 Tax=Berryella wangjianweii TaxID=2734634 RepID=A0A6M8J1Q8_9ACTN|nr:DHH family phosphoesterase [Berryella wangjianweii]QKF07031.1 bifunctional oligoribonuclease/PAP phosphatase NrnA [Berryella wangjianweii]
MSSALSGAAPRGVPAARLTPQSNASLEQIAEALRGADDIVVCGHVSPDGDCIGSQLALTHTLNDLGKRVTPVLADARVAPPSLAFLPGSELLTSADDFQGPCEAFVAVDVPTVERIGAAARIHARASLTITIDHHAAPQAMSQMVYVEPEAPATALRVWDLCRLLVGAPSPAAAQCAFTGLATDTGSFQYASAGEGAFRTAADMIACGADPALTAREFFQRRTLASLQVQAQAIGSARFLLGGAAVLGTLDSAQIASAGAVKSDIEPVVDALRSIEGVEVAVLLRQQDGIVRGSARAKSTADVAQMARLFGGGGHVAAAGFSIDAPLDEAAARVSAAIERLYGPCASQVASGASAEDPLAAGASARAAHATSDGQTAGAPQ